MVPKLNLTSAQSSLGKSAWSSFLFGILPGKLVFNTARTLNSLSYLVCFLKDGTVKLSFKLKM